MHLVQTMAYVNKVPWHGLGQQLAADQPIEVWAEQAGTNWRNEAADVRFAARGADVDAIRTFPEQKVLHRSDTKAPLAIVSRRYQVVQPAEILEFYRDFTNIGGFELESPGVLKEGRKCWALARTDQTVSLKGRDQVNGYMLLATACDGTLATTAQFTSVRVFCNNPGDCLGKRYGRRERATPHPVRCPGGQAPEAFLHRVRTYPAAPITERDATIVNERAVKSVQKLFAGCGKGSALTSAAGTAWGLVNRVAEFVGHHRRARNDEHRLDAAWFGQGVVLEQKAWQEALRLVA